MARYKESLVVETDEPDPKVQRLNASASGADEPAGIELKDQNTEDLHVPIANIPRTEEECPSVRSSCSVFKQENCQL